MEPSELLDHLCIEPFISSFIDAQALKTALDLGLIDRLRDDPSCTLAALRKEAGADGPAQHLMIDLLALSGVVEVRDGKVSLSRRFATALAYRDLLEAKLDFASCVAPDLIDRLGDLIRDPEAFRAKARIFDLFAYDRCYERSPENYRRTRRWMRITTALTRYEARVCTRLHDFGGYRRMLDVGGNSGEFALQLCRESPRLGATILDLPLVCDIGREHVFSQPEADRIRFVAGDALRDPPPGEFDLVTFKSMLHDWPDGEAVRLLDHGTRALSPGGTLLIFERGPLALKRSPSYSMLPFLLLLRSFRGPARYLAALRATGFEEIDVRWIDLESPFFLLTARKPRA